MKVVINACFGGFALSVAARQWIYEKYGPLEQFSTPVEKYFGSGGGSTHLRKWHEYLRRRGGDESFLTVFSPDEKYILDTFPRAERNDPVLVEMVEALGSERASGNCAELKIIEVPDGLSFEIEEYDGRESVAETHRVWS